MQTQIRAQTWRRRGAEHATRRPRRKREHRQAGFLGRNAAVLRRCIKHRSHRQARKAARRELRSYVTALAA